MKFAEAKPSIRLLIFDLDGTLIDSKLDLALSVNATLRHLGREPLDEETISSYVGQGAPTLIRRVVGEEATAEEIARGLEYFLTYYWEHKLDHTELYPGVRETLERLADGAVPSPRVMAVLTNKPERVSRDILKGLDIIHLFRFIYGGNTFETKKPDPLGIHKLLEQTGISPRAAMIVGDSDVDILTGANAGVWSCGVTYGFGTLQLDANPPDLLIDRLTELATALRAGGTSIAGG
jgi:phosphoglycolate phosphatase